MPRTVGLIMGTRVWYPLWDAATDDDAAFERRIDSLVREIGDRGKLGNVPAGEPLEAPRPVATSVQSPTASQLQSPCGFQKIAWFAGSQVARHTASQLRL